jgi:SAM-dependent methyltransferase
MDRSNGYEGIAPQFLARRGSGRSTGIGVNQVRKWARTLPPGAAVIDLGCGPGFPITEVLVGESLSTFGVDAAPSFVQAFQRNLPNTPVVCEAVQDSRFFDRTFDGVLAWGLMFLLSPEDQRHLIERIAGILVPGGRLLFTSPAEPIVWNDAMTGLESRSLGAAEYRRHMSAVGLSVASEYEDEGQNHYFDAFKDAHSLANPQPILADATPEAIHSDGLSPTRRLSIVPRPPSKRASGSFTPVNLRPLIVLTL